MRCEFMTFEARSVRPTTHHSPLTTAYCTSAGLPSSAVRLGIDLDGVVADFNAGWIRRYNQEYGSELPMDAVKAWDAIPSLTHFEDMGEFWKWARDHDGHTLFRHLDTYPGAVDALWATQPGSATRS